MQTWKFITVGSIIACLVIVILMFAVPLWNVWQQGLAGEAALRRAEQTRKIQIEQARGEKEAAGLRAEAIAIVGKAARDFPEYRQQEFIGAFAEALHSGKINQIIYVPTEANIPIIEAGRYAPRSK
jgi:regulator of protease activity HflC (stomatin/prohibitin superfamily)